MMARRLTIARIGLGLVAIVTIVSLLPLVGLVAAGMIADRFGCILDEGSVHPCTVAGQDLGGPLYAAFVGGWLALLTAPVMLATAAFWIVCGVRAVIRWRARRRN